MNLIPLEELSMSDIFLETLSVLAYVFILIMVFYANKRNPVFKSKAFPVLVLGILLGFTSAFMDLVSEFIFFNAYDIYKLLMTILQIASLVIFGLALLFVFKFTTFMLGEDPSNA